MISIYKSLTNFRISGNNNQAENKMHENPVCNTQY